MSYATYVKNYAAQHIELYFDKAPHYTIRSQLKSCGWYWHAEKMCWMTQLSRNAEQQAISIGASDGTPPLSNPEVSAIEMDLNSIRSSMVALFKDQKFSTYSLHQINEYLDSKSGSNIKFVHVNLSCDDSAAFVLADPITFNFASVGITSDPKKANEYNHIFSADSPFAQTLIRNVAYLRPYVLYRNSVYRIMGVSDTSYIRQVAAHTKRLNPSDSYVDVWVYRLKRPCPNHNIESVTAYVASDRSLVEQPINVAYCPVCQRYYINADQYKAFVHKNGLPYLRLKSFTTPDYSQWQEESLLHYMGYNVSSVDGMSARERWHVLEHAIDTKAMSKIEVISFLEFLIHQSENNPRLVRARGKWESDVQYIRNYKLSEQKYVRGRFILRM